MLGDNDRVKFWSLLLFSLFACSCGVSGEELSELEARVLALEQREETSSGTSRSLVEQSEGTVSVPDQAIGEHGDGLPTVAPSGAVVLIEAALVESPFYGLASSAEGGTNLETDGREAVVSLRGLGLVDRELLLISLLRIGFTDEDLAAIRTTETTGGSAITTDGAYTLRWNSTEDSLDLTVSPSQ